MEANETRLEGTPPRLRSEARFLAAWAAIRESGADESDGLDALALEPWPADLQRLAGDLAAAARESRALGPVLRTKGRSLRAWIVALLGGDGPRPGAGLQDRAARLLGREARGERSRRALLLGRLSVLAEARAGFAEALGALARDEREHDEPVLAAALEKLVREKADAGWLALAQAREPFLPFERVVLSKATTPEALVAVLKRLARVERHGQESSAGAALARVARAAADKARPVRKALEGVFTGLEGALGLDAPRPAPRPAAPPPPPAAPPPASPAASDPTGELAARITVREVRKGPVKTIGPAGPDEPADEAPRAPAAPAAPRPVVDPAVDPAADLAEERASQRAMLAKSRAALTLLELESEPDADAIYELAGDLALLREMLLAARDDEGERLRRELDEVELRFAQWKKASGE